MNPRRHAAIAACLAAAVLGGVLSACSSQGTSETSATAEQSASPYEAERRTGTETLLHDWARALRTDDEQALRDLIDPDAAPGFVDSQLQLARDLQGADFDSFGFSIGDDAEVFVPQDIANRLDAIDAWGPPVYLDFRLAGVDDATLHTPVGAIVARRGDTWKLVSTDELQNGTHPTWPAGPWVFGPVTSKRVPVEGIGDSLVLAHPPDTDEIDAVSGILPGSIAAVSDFWGTDWDRTVAVEIADNADEFSQLTGNPAERTDVAAASISFDSDVPAHGQRIVFGPGALTKMSPDAAQLVLTHELSHVAVREDVGRGAPTWLLEGTADYVAGRSPGGPAAADPIPLVAAMVDAHGAPNALPSDSDFAGPNADLAYELARSVADYIVETHGEDGLRAVHGALAGGGQDDDAKDEAMRGAIGTDMNQFTSGWSAWLGKRFG